MKEFQILDIKRSIFDDNDRQARQLRERLKKEQVFLLNLMSAPGSGKTTLLPVSYTHLTLPTIA